MASAPSIPAKTERAIDRWIAKGCRVILEDGRMEIIPPKDESEDLDLIDFRRRK